jgi:ADP-ribosylation factor-like protein 2-binding protein
MEEFSRILSERNPHELEGDVFDLIDTLGNFVAFKELVLSHNVSKSGTGADLSDLLSVTPHN